MPIVRTSVTSDAPRATCFASNGLAAGSAATTTEPTNGTTPRTVTHGKALTSDPHQHDCGNHQSGTGEHGQRVGAHESVLIAPDPPGPPADQSGEPIDRAVDDPVVDEHQGAGEVLAGAHDDGLVERVLQQVLTCGTRQRAAHGSHHRD